MFQMIGGDGREYGPVSAEQLNDWISAGRANGQTKARREGETDWKTLANFPEFTEGLAAKATGGSRTLPAPDPGPSNPSASDPASHQTEPGPLPLGAGAGGSGPTASPETLIADALSRSYTIDLGSALGRAWDLLKSDFWPIVGVTALVVLIVSAAHSLFVGLLVNAPLMGGLFSYYLKKIRGGSAEVGDAFSGFSTCFVQLFLSGLVSSLLIGVGLVLCVLPGIYLGIAWQLSTQLTQDKRLAFWDGLEVSRRVLGRNWWGMLAFSIVAGLINIGGSLLCGIGVFVTLPWTLLALAYIYEDLFGTPRGA